MALDDEATDSYEAVVLMGWPLTPFRFAARRARGDTESREDCRRSRASRIRVDDLRSGPLLVGAITGDKTKGGLLQVRIGQKQCENLRKEATRMISFYVPTKQNDLLCTFRAPVHGWFPS